MYNEPPDPKSKIQNPTWEEIDARCAQVVLQAIASFPKLLRECDAEQAAAIVADLIKVQVTRPTPEPDLDAALAEIMRVAAEDVESRHSEDEPKPAPTPEPEEHAGTPQPHCPEPTEQPGLRNAPPPPIAAPASTGIWSSGHRCISEQHP